MKREESQNVEYKESWHDKYLEWVCGYADTQGGMLYFGKRMPSLESESDYFRVTLPNLLYGFTDEQLVAAVDNSEYGVAKDAPPTAKTHHDTPPVDLKVERLILALKDSPLGTSELLKALHIRDRNYLREGYIRPTLRIGFIEQTKPDVKHSKLQKYRLTEKGRECLVGLESRQQLG